MSSTNKKNIKSSLPTKKEIIEFYKKNNRGDDCDWEGCELRISLNKNLTIIQLKDNKRYKYGLDICYGEYMDCIYGKENKLTLEYLQTTIADNKDFGIKKNNNRSSVNRQ